jgi:hypothetical protein
MHKDCVANTSANLEQNHTHAANAALQNGLFNCPVRIAIHSVRQKLADSDGISAKAAIDGIVEAGVLKNDTPKEVENVSYSQDQGEKEYTVITITEMTESYKERLRALGVAG